MIAGMRASSLSQQILAVTASPSCSCFGVVFDVVYVSESVASSARLVPSPLRVTSASLYPSRCLACIAFESRPCENATSASPHLEAPTDIGESTAIGASPRPCENATPPFLCIPLLGATGGCLGARRPIHFCISRCPSGLQPGRRADTARSGSMPSSARQANSDAMSLLPQRHSTFLNSESSLPSSSGWKDYVTLASIS